MRTHIMNIGFLAHFKVGTNTDKYALQSQEVQYYLRA